MLDLHYPLTLEICFVKNVTFKWQYLGFNLESFIRPFFPNNPWCLRVCSTGLLKTPWEKDKLLVTNNVSFSPSFFYAFGKLSDIFIKFNIVVCKLFQFGRVQNLSLGKGLSIEFNYIINQNAIVNFLTL